MGYASLINLIDYGIEDVTPPAIYYFKSVFVTTMCKPIKKAMVNEEGQIVVRKIMKFNFWVDHRYADGADANKHLPKFLEVVKNPNKFFHSK